jgi:predicted transposase YbfD/YdcC
MEITRIVDRTNGKKHTEETVYAITSLYPEEASEETLLALVRGHWTVEAMHWIRDVTFDEDRSRVRTGHAPRAMATLRNLSLSLVRLWGYRTVAQGTRKLRANPESALDRLAI